MYNDAPFGYDLFPHDVQITVNNLIEQSKQFDALNTNGTHVWIVIHKIEDTHIVAEAMTERHYQNLQHVYQHMPGQYVEGPVHRLTPSVNVMTIGFLPNSSAITWNVSKDPQQRHNFVSIPSVSTLAKDSSGNAINVTEKPPELAEFLLGMFCKKGSTVLIVGTGAGGCVKGALRAGYNVVGVENDERQYNALFSEMNAWLAKMQKEKEDAAAAAEKPKRGPKTSVSPDDKKEEIEAQPSSLITLQAAVVEGKCFSCDLEGTDDDPLGQCLECEKWNHTKECMLDYDGNDKSKTGLVCGGCHASLFGAD